MILIGPGDGNSLVLYDHNKNYDAVLVAPSSADLYWSYVDEDASASRFLANVPLGVDVVVPLSTEIDRDITIRSITRTAYTQATNGDINTAESVTAESDRLAKAVLAVVGKAGRRYARIGVDNWNRFSRVRRVDVTTVAGFAGGFTSYYFDLDQRKSVTTAGVETEFNELPDFIDLELLPPTYPAAIALVDTYYIRVQHSVQSSARADGATYQDKVESLRFSEVSDTLTLVFEDGGSGTLGIGIVGLPDPFPYPDGVGTGLVDEIKVSGSDFHFATPYRHGILSADIPYGQYLGGRKLHTGQQIDAYGGGSIDDWTRDGGNYGPVKTTGLRAAPTLPDVARLGYHAGAFADSAVAAAHGIMRYDETPDPARHHFYRATHTLGVLDDPIYSAAPQALGRIAPAVWTNGAWRYSGRIDMILADTVAAASNDVPVAIEIYGGLASSNLTDATGTRGLRVDQVGNAVLGVSDRPAAATGGFPWIPKLQGTPTGTPSPTYAGYVPLALFGTSLMVYDGAWVSASGASKWNSLTAPDGNLALTMAAYTTAFTWNAATGATTDLFTVQNTTDDTGTGALLKLSTPGGANAKTPLSVSIRGGGSSWMLNADGSLSHTTILANAGTVSIARGHKLDYTDNSTAEVTAGRRGFYLSYTRQGTGTVSGANFDAMIGLDSFVISNLAYELRGIDLKAPLVSSGITLATWTGLRLRANTGAGTITNNYGLIADSAFFNGLGTTAPTATLHVDGTMKFALSGNDTGDTWYQNSSGFVTRLPRGTVGQVLGMGAFNVPLWITNSPVVPLNDVTHPAGNTAFAMSTGGTDYTLAFTWDAATGSTTPLFSIANGSNDTGTGTLVSISTPGASNAKRPFVVSARGSEAFAIGVTGAITVSQDARFGGVIDLDPVSPATAASGQGRLYYDLSAGALMWSQNGTSFEEVITGTDTQTLTNKILGSGTTFTLGSDATGDIWYRNSGGNVTRLAIGATGTVLTVAAGLPSWAAASSMTVAGSGTELQYRSSGTALAAVTGSSVSGGSVTIVGDVKADGGNTGYVLADVGGTNTESYISQFGGVLTYPNLIFTKASGTQGSPGDCNATADALGAITWKARNAGSYGTIAEILIAQSSSGNILDISCGSTVGIALYSSGGASGIEINTTAGDATGDIYYRNSSGRFTRLAVGTNGHVLTLASGLPSWAAPAGGMTVAGSATELQYRVNGTTLGAVTSSTVSGANMSLGGAIGLARLTVHSTTTVSTDPNGILINWTNNTTDGSGGNALGVVVQDDSRSNHGGIWGIYASITKASTSTSTTTSNYVIYGQSFVASDLLTQYGCYVKGANVSSGKTLTNYYGLYLSGTTGTGTVTNKYGVIVESTAGNSGFGTTAPTTTLHVSGTLKIDLTSSATGDIHFRNSSGNQARLGIGTLNQVLKTGPFGVPLWADLDFSQIDLTNAGTNVISPLFTLDYQSSGTPAAGFGGRIQHKLESSTTANQDAVFTDWRWQNATHASRTAVYSIKTAANGDTPKERVLLGGYKTLTDNTRADLFTITFAAADHKALSGHVYWTIMARKTSGGNDIQVMRSAIPFAALHNAATNTGQAKWGSPAGISIETSGSPFTLTMEVNNATGLATAADVFTFQITANSDLASFAEFWIMYDVHVSGNGPDIVLA